jgi:hypothetical protein
VGDWRGIAAWTAGLAVAVGLFPTMRAIVNGSAARPSIAPVKSSGPGPITKAVMADRAARPGTTRVLLVGNSVAHDLAPAFSAIAGLDVLDVSVLGCGFPPELTGVVLKLPDGQAMGQPSCDPSWEATVVAKYHPTIVFWIVSDPIGTGGEYLGRRVRPCDANYDALYVARLEQEIGVLGRGGAKVVVPTEAYSRFPGAHYDRATDCQNAARRSAVAATGVQLLDLFGYVCPKGLCRTVQDGEVLRPDGLHYEGPGSDIVAQWLMSQVNG